MLSTMNTRTAGYRQFCNKVLCPECRSTSQSESKLYLLKASETKLHLSDDECGRLAGNAAICPLNQSLTASNPVCVPILSDMLKSYDTPVTLPYPPNACHACQPIVVHYRLKSPGFNIFDRYDTAFVSYLSGGLNLTQDQVVLKDYTWQSGPRLAMTIDLLPGAPNNTFNQSEFSRLYNTFSNWKIPDSPVFGPYELISFDPRTLQGTPSHTP